MDRPLNKPVDRHTEVWLKSVLLKHGSQIFERCFACYTHLAALPRATRRKLKIATGTGLATLALAMALSGAPTAQAATITVDGTNCTLAEAITSANNDNAAGNGCVDGSGADTIELTGNVTLVSALPNITSDITINGNGHTINANNGAFSIFYASGSTADLTITNATITGMLNPTEFDSAVYVHNGATVTIHSSTITGNTKSGGSASGAAISAFGNGNPTAVNIHNSTINNNNGLRGAIAILDTVTLNMTNSTVSNNNNTGETEGGGLRVGNGSTANITNSTITNNSTNENEPGFGGGGIFVHPSANLTLVRSIVSGNTNTGSGAAVEIDAPSGSGSRTFTNNVLGDNGETNAQAFYNVSLEGNITATSNGTNPTALDDILNTLTNNGGPTLTHALVSGSPAIDIAPAANCASAPINGLDQRGVARSQDGNGNGTAACDAGAVEMGQLQCGIQAAPKPFPLTFAQSSNVLVNVTDAGTDLDCVRVTEIGQDHPEATSSMINMALQTGRYWQIAGYQNNTSDTPATTDFTVDLTLPFATADTNSRACKWLGVTPPTTGFGWDCGDDADNDAVPGVSVTRLNYTDGFSDWAVGDEVGPTAVSNLHTQTNTPNQAPYIPLLATLLTLLSGAWLWLRRQTA